MLKAAGEHLMKRVTSLGQHDYEVGTVGIHKGKRRKQGLREYIQLSQDCWRKEIKT